jgi:ribosomal protein S18 acetylase RimI-like enzyme
MPRAIAQLHLRTVVFAYDGIFPTEGSPPDLDELHRDWDRRLSRPGESVFVAERQTIIGSVIARLDADHPTSGEVARLHVDPESWGQGIGTDLLQHALSELDQRGCSGVGLWVLERNDRARRFYERNGWVLEQGKRTPWPAKEVVEVRYLLPSVAHPFPKRRSAGHVRDPR